MSPDFAAVMGGLAGPLVATIVSSILVTRSFRRNPASVTNLMIAAFMVKAVFFALYVVVMIKVFALDLVPFAVSFGASFIVLYSVQAAMFSRLFRRAQTEAK
jgi:hypothetical protein